MTDAAGTCVCLNCGATMQGMYRACLNCKTGPVVVDDPTVAGVLPCLFAEDKIQQARSQAIDDCIKVNGDGGRPLPFDRDGGGRMVREAWVRWALAQPNPKPSWLVPYDELSEADKEADRQIAEAVGRWTIILDTVNSASRLEAMKGST